MSTHNLFSVQYAWNGIFTLLDIDPRSKQKRQEQLWNDVEVNELRKLRRDKEKCYEYSGEWLRKESQICQFT